MEPVSIIFIPDKPDKDHLDMLREMEVVILDISGDPIKAVRRGPTPDPPALQSMPTAIKARLWRFLSYNSLSHQLLPTQYVENTGVRSDPVLSLCGSGTAVFPKHIGKNCPGQEPHLAIVFFSPYKKHYLSSYKPRCLVEENIWQYKPL